MGSSIRDEILHILKSTFCFGLSIDSSSDISNKEILIIVVKYVDP